MCREQKREEGDRNDEDACTGRIDAEWQRCTKKHTAMRHVIACIWMGVGEVQPVRRMLRRRTAWILYLRRETKRMGKKATTEEWKEKNEKNDSRAKRATASNGLRFQSSWEKKTKMEREEKEKEKDEIRGENRHEDRGKKRENEISSYGGSASSFQEAIGKGISSPVTWIRCLCRSSLSWKEKMTQKDKRMKRTCLWLISDARWPFQSFLREGAQRYPTKNMKTDKTELEFLEVSETWLHEKQLSKNQQTWTQKIEKLSLSFCFWRHCDWNSARNWTKSRCFLLPPSCNTWMWICFRCLSFSLFTFRISLYLWSFLYRFQTGLKNVDKKATRKHTQSSSSSSSCPDSSLLLFTFLLKC